MPSGSSSTTCTSEPIGGGRGVTKNEAEGLKWLRKAADQKYVPAYVSVGYCYEAGRGVAKNEAEAVSWYRKAAEQGDAAGQSNLGLAYENGRWL